MSNPVIEFRADTTPFAVQSSFSLTGSGFSGAIIAGTSSSVITFRIYNNFANAGGVHDALNCVLTTYDDSTNQGTNITLPVLQQWVRVSVLSYDTSIIGGDGTTFFPVGGVTKHAVPVNGGTLAGAAPHYIRVNLKVVVPAFAAATLVTQGIWIEYSYV